MSHPIALKDAGQWRTAVDAIDWVRRPKVAFDGQSWFPDGSLNTCFNAVDRHVIGGRGSQPALIYDSPVSGQRKTYSFEQLRNETARLAGAIRALGVAKGDRVLIYMPMVPEAIVAMLACARIGAIHSVVFGGFSAMELARRIDDAEPTLVLSASCGIEPGRIVAYKPIVDEALLHSRHEVGRCLILQREQCSANLVPGRDLDWTAFAQQAEPVDCVELEATDPLYILYTSGTTGTPKGVVRDNGGHAVALSWAMDAVYGAKAGDVFWAASDIGWVVGHSFCVYGPLLYGCTTVVYEGKPVGTPDPGAFWRVAREHEVDILFTAPTAIRAIKREDPTGDFLLAHRPQRLRAVFLAGETTDAATRQWLIDNLDIPVIDHWWQTELGWPAIATCLGRGDRETRTGSAGRPVPGYACAVVDDDGKELPAGSEGQLVLQRPLPPGCFIGLWNRLDAEQGPLYFTGDAARIDGDGFISLRGRVDDIINVAGHRLSTTAMENLIAGHADVAECAVVGVADALKGSSPLGVFVMKAGAERDSREVAAELVALVHEGIGPVAAFKRAVAVPALPKTRSGKILRGLIRQIADSQDVSVPATIDDPSIVEALRRVLAPN